jgi:alpha-ketoglutarate-dependent taurine dioxygenase
MTSGPRRRGTSVRPTAANPVRVLQPGKAEFWPTARAQMLGVELAAWLGRNRAVVEAHLLRHGAMLFRGFAVEGAGDFSAAARALAPELLSYLERAAPRKEVAPGVFTSTEFAADQWIPLHHEMSYSHNWPSRLYFYCDRPAAEGGATPLASERVVSPRIPPEIRERFGRDGILYVRNYGPDLDLPWQEVFQTTDRRQVEAYCRSAGASCTWIGTERLRTSSRHQAAARHPVTGEEVWFNHAHIFHSSNLPPDVSAALLSEFGPDGIPRNAFHGDGTPIEDEVAELIRQLYREATVSFAWRPGDVLAVDNFLAAHGREPFRGSRRILVAMSDLYQAEAAR